MNNENNNKKKYSKMVDVNDYTEKVLFRTKEARKKAGFKTQADIATAMKISRERYAKYETERIIHKELISKFCVLTAITERWLLTGGGVMKAHQETDYTQEETNFIEFRRNLEEKKQQAWDDMIELQKKIFDMEKKEE